MLIFSHAFCGHSYYWPCSHGTLELKHTHLVQNETNFPWIWLFKISLVCAIKPTSDTETASLSHTLHWPMTCDGAWAWWAPTSSTFLFGNSWKCLTNFYFPHNFAADIMSLLAPQPVFWALRFQRQPKTPYGNISSLTTSGLWQVTHTYMLFLFCFVFSGFWPCFRWDLPVSNMFCLFGNCK